MITVALLMTACVDDIAPPNKNEFKWISPQEGSSLFEGDLQQNATEVKLQYTSLSPEPPTIAFNAHDVSGCFTFLPTEATADLSCFSDYFINGENRIKVNHDILGTEVKFTIDAAAPTLAIREVCYFDSTHCTLNPSEGLVDVLIEYRDSSGIASTTLNDIAPYASPSANSRRYLITTSDTYSFTSSDSLGAESTVKYKADGQQIDEIIDIRVDETFIGNIKDILGDQISGYSIPHGDPALDPLQRLDADTFGLCDISVKAITLGDMEIKDIGISDSSPAQLTTDIDIKPIDPNYTYNNGSVENTNNVGVDVTVEVRTIGFFCLAPISLGDMRIYIETMEVNADVELGVSNGKFHLELHNPDSTNESALVMVDLGMDSALDGIIDWVMGLDFVRNLILGIIQKVINANLDEIHISKDIVTAHGTSMNIALKPETIRVENNPDDNIGDMFISMSGAVTTLIPDPDVRPALGSYQVPDDLLPVIPDNGSALAVTVNSNIVNQALLAAYNIGATHITVMNGATHLSPHVTDSMGVNGDLRVELYPASPGQFFTTHSTLDKAYMEYNGAELTISIKDAGIWKPLFLIDVDIKFGVILMVRDSKVYVTIAESPTFIIRKTTDLKATKKIKLPFGTINVAIKIDGEIIGNLIKEAILLAVPFIAETEVEIDISKMNLPSKMSTSTLTTEGGHLGFDIDVE